MHTPPPPFKELVCDSREDRPCPLKNLNLEGDLKGKRMQTRGLQIQENPEELMKLVQRLGVLVPSVRSLQGVSSAGVSDIRGLVFLVPEPVFWTFKKY